MTQKKVKNGQIAATINRIDQNEMFLKRALEKLLNEKDIKRSQYQQLKLACETALTSVNKDIQSLQ